MPLDTVTHAPGTPNGVFLAPYSVGSTREFALNGRNQLAALVSRSGNVNSSNDTALYVTDLSGAMQLIAREGDLLDIGSGVMRTVSSLDFFGGSGGQDGRARGFNDAGQLAFLATRRYILTGRGQR